MYGGSSVNFLMQEDWINLKQLTILSSFSWFSMKNVNLVMLQEITMVLKSIKLIKLLVGFVITLVFKSKSVLRFEVYIDDWVESKT